MLMGVHTNMCVLGRPFGLRNMARSGKNVVLVRDLTDTMYNSRKWPYVSHFEGTNRIVEHIEKYVAPTITSTDLTGQPAFQFKADDRPRAVFLIGEDEYKTETTLPAFAVKELEPLGVRCTFVIADPKSPHDFPGVEALERRGSAGPERAPSRSHDRTDGDHSQVSSTRASRWWAFARPATPSMRGARPPRGMPNGSRSIPTCWAAITRGIMPTMSIPRSRSRRAIKTHEIVRDIETPFNSHGSLYKVQPAGRGHAGSADGDDTRASRPSRSRGSTGAGRRGSSTRRSATPTISRSFVPHVAP